MINITRIFHHFRYRETSRKGFNIIILNECGYFQCDCSNREPPSTMYAKVKSE